MNPWQKPLIVRPGEPLTEEQRTLAEKERRTAKRLAVFWGVLAVPTVPLGLLAVYSALWWMLVMDNMGRFGFLTFLTLVLFAPTYLAVSFRGRMRSLDDLLAGETNEASA